MSRLAIRDIKLLADREGVKRIAVENFLFSMTGDFYTDINHLKAEKRLYKWNSATVKAIKEGIKLHEKGGLK